MKHSGLSASVAEVVERFDVMLGDGATLQIGDFDDGVLRLVYQPADGAVECDACVLAPDDLEILVLEALQLRSSPVTSVLVARPVEPSANSPEEGT